MKKKLTAALSLLLVFCLMSGCALCENEKAGLDSFLRSVFNIGSSAEENSANDSSSSVNGAGGAEPGDTVTISREEYERYRQFDKVLTVMDIADAYFYQETDHDKMLEGAAAGVLNALGDEYTFYYDADSWKRMWEDDEGEYAGIGIMISGNYLTGICTITRVFKGSPAEAAGVRRGDILYKVNGDLTVTARTLDDAVAIMRGTPGTKVDVTFLRDGEEYTIAIERAMIKVNQIESKMLTDEVGIIAFYQFAGESHLEFENALNELVGNGAKGIIIDMRDNPGGWVDQAQYIADLFLDSGEVCYTVYRDGSEDHASYTTTDGKIDVPLVILINENTASSSEILTGVLRERGDATVVGVTSFGKGVIQAVVPVGNETGLQVTVAEYFLPSGYKMHHVGITPDVEVPLEEGDNGEYDFADTENDPQLKKALEVMEEKLK